MDVAFRIAPFRYALVAPVFQPEPLESCLTVLEAAVWESVRGDFYTIDIPNTLDTKHSLIQTIGENEIARLHRRLEACFDVKLRPRPKIDVQRYCPGYGIGPHTDFVDSEVRLVVNMSRQWIIEDGGIWILAADPSLASGRVLVPPATNTGFMFATSASSFHALSIRQTGIGYGLVFCFTKEE